VAYRTFLAISPSPEVKADLADALRLSGRLGEAERLYREILEKAPENAESLWGLSQVRFYQAQWGPAAFSEAALEESRRLLKTLTDINPLFALGFWRLAEVLERLGETDEALEAYEKTLATDGNFKKAYARMARLLKWKKDYEGALAKYEKAKAVEPDNEELRLEARELGRRNPEVAVKRGIRREEKWCSLKIPRETPLSSTAVTVRVGIETGLGHLKFKGGSALRVTTSAGTFVTRLEKETDYHLRYRSAEKGESGRESWSIEDASGRILTAFDARLWIVPEDPESSLALHAVASGAGYFFAREEDRFYRGFLEISPRKGKGFNVINRVNLEAYTAGVLPSEMPSSWPLEALKVQAVVARSYVLAKLGRHNTEGYDVCDEVHCAAYNGIGAESEKTNRAVNETAGMVLQIGKRVLPVVYAAQCGGRTQDYGEAWGYEIPVLGVPDYDPRQNRGVDFPLTPARLEMWIKGDPAAYCNTPSLKGYRNFRWAYSVPVSELEAKVPGIGRLMRVAVSQRSKAGWATRLILVGEKGQKEFKGDSVRGILGGLRSSLIYLETQMDGEGNPVELVVYGGGWGHGVGLCQVGVWGQVKAGKKWKDILKHYFPKASLKRL
jgi:SpoIID/LytB domain protein